MNTVGCTTDKREEELLLLLAKAEMERLQGMQPLFVEDDDLVVDNFVNSIANDHLQIIGPELILGEIYQEIGFPGDGCPNYFKNLERLLKKNNISMSPEKAIKEIKEIKQLRYILPKSQQVKTKILQPSQCKLQLLEMKI